MGLYQSRGGNKYRNGLPLLKGACALHKIPQGNLLQQQLGGQLQRVQVRSEVDR